MSFTRFEAFSDGVFAIAITLLVIEIHVPDITGHSFSEAMQELWHLAPHFISYLTSFMVIGVIWLNHNALFHFVKRVDRTILLLNLVLLMCIAFIPFTTALVGNHPNSQPAVFLYGLWLTLLGVVWNTLWACMVRRHILPTNLAPRAAVRAASLWSVGYPIGYLTAAMLSFLHPVISVILYALIPLIYLLPSPIDALLRGLGPSEG